MLQGAARQDDGAGFEGAPGPDGRLLVLKRADAARAHLHRRPSRSFRATAANGVLPGPLPTVASNGTPFPARVVIPHPAARRALAATFPAPARA